MLSFMHILQNCFMLHKLNVKKMLLFMEKMENSALILKIKKFLLIQI
uniref:Uncharacterized protein n=1 Tax=Cryptosporidium parvum TaxID=5807 RepID=A0A7S7LEY6_CRYPV|eukprot:QOY40880.1 hypothetical protein CPATCC_002494 [Cryptosporidium parvum]